MSLRDRWSSLFVHRPSAPPGPSEALPQPWPATKVGPRVMVEHEDPGWRWAASERLTSAGYEVACCGGPRVLPRQRCPVVAGEPCPLLDGADVIVNGLGITTTAARAVLTAVHAQRPDLPVIVELPTSRFDDLEAMAPGCRPVAFPVGPKHLARAVDEAIKERAAGE